MEPQTRKPVDPKKDGNEFQRFDDLLRTVVSVPKDEINKREKAEREKKASKNETRKKRS